MNRMCARRGHNNTRHLQLRQYRARPPIAGVRCCDWITAQLSSLNGNLAVQLLLTPVIALGLAAPGSYLVFKIWKEG